GGGKARAGRTGRKGRGDNRGERLRASGRDHGVLPRAGRGGSRRFGRSSGYSRRLVLPGTRAPPGAFGHQHQHLRAQARLVL
ncbi:MAG: Menaquinone-cytochrome C oxidoreductase, cytochrome C subunit, partial [uncultured Rubrobacteraceae bacterium]